MYQGRDCDVVYIYMPIYIFVCLRRDCNVVERSSTSRVVASLFVVRVLHDENIAGHIRMG